MFVGADIHCNVNGLSWQLKDSFSFRGLADTDTDGFIDPGGNYLYLLLKAEASTLIE